MKLARYTDGKLRIPIRVDHAIDARTMVYIIAEAIDRKSAPTSRRAAVALARRWRWSHGVGDDDPILWIHEGTPEILPEAARITARLFPEWEEEIVEDETFAEPDPEEKPEPHAYVDPGGYEVPLCSRCGLGDRHPVHDIHRGTGP